MLCPRCHSDLSQISDKGIFLFFCPACHGQAVTMSGMRSLGIEEDSIRKIWSAAVKGKLGNELPCPECGNLMCVVKIDDGQTVFYIDVCTKCHILWFDSGELEKIPLTPAEKVEELPQRAREILAEHAIKNVKPPADHSGLMYASYRNFRIPSEEEMPFALIIAALNLIIRLFLR